MSLYSYGIQLNGKNRRAMICGCLAGAIARYRRIHKMGDIPEDAE